MVKPILSFILPCYNVENYIGSCLDSLFAQDIPEEEYEVICVNDCSSDCTEKIIRNYQEKYSIIRLFNHTMNKTAGGARNTWLENALGKYVWFVDPDDIIEPNVVRHLLNHCITGDLDILMFNHREINKDGNELSVKSTFINSEVDTGLTYINKFFENNLNVSETSRQLFIHRNTLVYRIEKLQKATGLDIRVFDDALTFKIALMVVNYMKYLDTLDY